MKKILYLLFVLSFAKLNAQNCYQTVAPPAGFYFSFTNQAGQNITRCANNDFIISCVLTDSNTSANSNAIIRYDQNMNLLWSKKINVAGLPDLEYDFHKITELPNGDLHVYFSANDDDYNTYHYAMRMTGTGDFTWSKNFYVDYNGNPYGPPRMKMNSNGDMLVVLSYVESVHVVKVNSQGNTVFGYDITIDPSKNPGFDCELRSDCSIITAKAGSDCEFIKIDNSGNIVWVKRYEEQNYYTQPRSICSAADGNFFVTGMMNDTEVNGMLMKIDSSGAVLWVKKYTSTSLGVNGFDKVVELANGHILLYESTESKILECDAQGNILQTQVMTVQNPVAYELSTTGFLFLGTKYVEDLNGFSMVFIHDDLGFSNYNVFQGSTEMSMNVANYNPTITTSYNANAMDFSTMPDSAVAVSDLNMSLILTDYCIATTGISKVSAQDAISVFPNPASTDVTIDFGKSGLSGNLVMVFYDINGKEVKTVHASTLGSEQQKIDIGDLNNGIYFLKAGLSGDAPVMNKRIVVSK